MNKFFNKSVALALGLAVCGACDAEPAYFDGGDVDEYVEYRGGMGLKMNTNKLGAKEFSLLSNDYQPIGDVQLISVELVLKGTLRIQCKRVWSHKGELRCDGADGNQYGSWYFEKSEWKIRIGASVFMAVIGELELQNNIWLYRFNDLASGPDKIPTCDEDDDDPGTFWSVAIPDINVKVDGSVHDEPKTFYLGCTSGGIGKTVKMMGYTPWGLPLPQFEAGIRMTRFDACGDGNSLTVPGTPLRLEDTWGLNKWGPGYPVSDSEGVYGPHGLICSGKESRLGPMSDPIKCGGGVEIPVCDDVELKDIWMSDADHNMWVKPL